MPGNGDTDMLLAMVSEELDALEERLGQLEVEMLSRSDNGDGPVPVAGSGSAALLEQTLERGYVMATTTIILNDTLVGTVISPFPDGFVARLMLTQSQQPAWQQEHRLALPYPRGRWTSGRFVLTDQGGAGQRVFNFPPKPAPSLPAML